MINRTTTKSQAVKVAENYDAGVRKDLVGQARQQALDATDQVVDLSDTPLPRSGDIETSVSFTEKQKGVFAKYLGFPKPFQEGVNSYPFKQKELTLMQESLQALIDSGNVKGVDARVVKNLVEKMDNAVRKIAPEVRIRQASEQIQNSTNRFLDHGDYC